MKAKEYLEDLNNSSSREILKPCVLWYTAKPNRVKSLFTTAQHAFDRTRTITILAKHKVTETKRSACWEEHDREGRKHFSLHFSLQGFFITGILKHCFVKI